MSQDKISKALGLTPLSELNEEIKSVQQVESTEIEQIEKNLPVEVSEEDENLNDLQLARANVKNIIELGDDAVKEMVEIAKQSESPRAFEVVSTLMKTLLDANKDYVDISTKKKYAQEEKPAAQSETNVTNNNLILSTADLLKMIKGDPNDA
jgi:hypothetical protein